MKQTEFEQILSLIIEGRIEDAILMVAKYSADAILLQTRYSNGEKQYKIGLICIQEWNNIREKIGAELEALAISLVSHNKKYEDSISLRDYFAGLAMQAILSTRSGIVDAQEIAEMAYRQATAMLIEREKQTKE